uniref:Uncharacterized protein n=1 Tax=Oryza punctata TaxID=4537 RepID=A0A0E0MHY5_ORYPU
MLPDARKMLERIERDLAGGDLARNQMPEGGGGGGNGESTEEDVVGIAKGVVQQAVKARHKRAQVQRLAQLSQQVVDLMQDLQAFGVTRDEETRALLNKLKVAIQDAHRIVLSNQRRFLLSTFRSSSQRTTEILNVVYTIEFILHVLPVMVMTHNK